MTKGQDFIYLFIFIQDTITVSAVELELKQESLRRSGTIIFAYNY